jgi:hypothetical protein
VARSKCSPPMIQRNHFVSPQPSKPVCLFSLPVRLLGHPTATHVHPKHLYPVTLAFGHSTQSPMTEPLAPNPVGPTRICIEGYLTESKLSAALQQIMPGGWIGDQVRAEGSRHRWDMSYQVERTVTVVEYDGDEHYRHSLKIKADRAKDEIARNRVTGWSASPTGYNSTTSP